MPEPTRRGQRLLWLVTAAVVAVSGWIYTVRYQECRAHQFSRFYCALGR